MTVHALEVYSTAKGLNETISRAFLACLGTPINEAGTDSRVSAAISEGAITASLLPSLLPFIDGVDWSRMHA